MIKTLDEWLKSRQKGIGSSDSPILALGEVFGKTPIDLYIEKKALNIYSEDNAQFRRGRTYEPLAIKIAEQKLGMKIYHPKTDLERWNDYHCWVDGEVCFSDFDGIREDGVVVEVKSPMSRTVRKIKDFGVADYVQVQGQHLINTASKCKLPGLGYTGKCDAVCFVYYDCEEVDVHTFEVPRNDMMINVIQRNADRFWNQVTSNNPPIKDTCEVIKVDNIPGRYEIADENLDVLMNNYSIAKIEKRGHDEARLKELISNYMNAKGIDKVVNSYGHKIVFKEENGKTTFDKKHLQADFPDLDLKKYEKRGKSKKVFRFYKSKG